MSSHNSNSNSNNNENQNHLLQNLMARLQIRPPYLNTNSFLSQSLEDFLSSDPNLSSSDDDDEEPKPYPDKTHLAKEESLLEKEIIRRVLTGKSDSLRPNSGHTVAIGEHHICVTFQEEAGSGYRVWEWHGHIMLLDEEDGYTPEYIYGNYYQWLPAKHRSAGGGAEDPKKEEVEEEEEEEEETDGDVGLKGLFVNDDSTNGRIIHRNLNAGSAR